MRTARRTAGSEVKAPPPQESIESHEDAAGFHPLTHLTHRAGEGCRVLGRLVEVVSGRDFADYIENESLTPAGMGNSFVSDGAIHETIATGHPPWFMGRRPVADRARKRELKKAKEEEHQKAVSNGKPENRCGQRFSLLSTLLSVL